MRDTLLSLFATATLIAFLGILLVEVPRLDLGVVIGITVLLVVWDLFATHRDRQI